MQFSNDEIHKKAWKGITTFAESDPDILSRTFSVLYKKIIDTPFVYLGGIATSSAAARDRCDIVFLEDANLPSQSLAVGSQNGSPFQDMVSDR